MMTARHLNWLQKVQNVMTTDPQLLALIRTGSLDLLPTSDIDLVFVWHFNAYQSRIQTFDSFIHQFGKPLGILRHSLTNYSALYDNKVPLKVDFHFTTLENIYLASEYEVLIDRTNGFIQTVIQQLPTDTHQQIYSKFCLDSLSYFSKIMRSRLLAAERILARLREEILIQSVALILDVPVRLPWVYTIDNFDVSWRNIILKTRPTTLNQSNLLECYNLLSDSYFNLIEKNLISISRWHHVEKYIQQVFNFLVTETTHALQTGDPQE